MWLALPPESLRTTTCQIIRETLGTFSIAFFHVSSSGLLYCLRRKATFPIKGRLFPEKRNFLSCHNKILSRSSYDLAPVFKLDTGFEDTFSRLKKMSVYGGKTIDNMRIILGKNGFSVKWAPSHHFALV
jgi:hypothetical protein